jgi:hypothetical protein
MTSPYLSQPLRSHAQFMAERAKPVHQIIFSHGVYDVALMRRNDAGAFTVDRYLSTHATLEEARASMPDAE